MDRSVTVVGVDTGGTFTDIFSSNGAVLKVPSTPENPAAAILEGLRAAGAGPGDAVAHGTTVATNAVLERKGARTVLLTTAGFEDVLEIRRQHRPDIYDLWARWPDPLVPSERRLGVPERLDWEGQVLAPVDESALNVLLEQVAEAESVAVCLLFSYANPEHEERVYAAVRARLGDRVPISVSHRIAPRYGEFERTSTTVLNAYVMPVVTRYLQALETDLRALGVTRLHVMHSNGGLLGVETVAERPVQTVLSGPAAGVVGAQAVSREAGYEEIITFDMGGTSTDVAVVPGEVLEGTEGTVATFPLLIPMMTIETVGAGGGSIAWIDPAAGLHVGPQSAGANPGPAAYGTGTDPTVTDANLVLGRLSSGGLLGGAMALDVARARVALATIAEPLGLTVEEAAWAVVRLANSNMERAVRTVTLQRGYDPRRFTLVAFGGAGPLHAAELADGLHIPRVLIPPHPGVMAALGLTVPPLQRDFQRTVLLPLAPASEERLEQAFRHLEDEALADLGHEELFGDPAVERFVEMRYVGQSFELRVPYVPSLRDLHDAFIRRYEERYGYASPDEPTEIVHIRVRTVLPRLVTPQLVPPWPESNRAISERAVWFGSPVRTEVHAIETRTHWRPSLPAGTVVRGPALLDQYDSTTLIPPEWEGRIDPAFNLVLSPIT